MSHMIPSENRDAIPFSKKRDKLSLLVTGSGFRRSDPFIDERKGQFCKEMPLFEFFSVLLLFGWDSYRSEAD